MQTRTKSMKIMGTLYILLLLASVAGFNCVSAERCYPGMSCWPQYQDLLDFMQSLDGEAYLSNDARYIREVTMHNTRTTRYPYIIIMAKTVDDVVRCVQFGNKFKIRITVRSSGHDYIGRSTADGSLQINLKLMKGLTFNLKSSRNPAGEVTAQSGNTWPRVYNESHKVGRSIVGGSASCVSVALGGYTLGGGHSPIGRKFGLAVDNLLAIEMVAANGSLVYANDANTTIVDLKHGINTTFYHSDIFWAVRGGGGSTYGIVTSFTFKLHYDSEVVALSCVVPYINAKGVNVGEKFAKTLNALLITSLAPEWGGYLFFSGQSDPYSNTTGSMSLNMNHYGTWGSPSFNSILPFLSEYRNSCQLTNKSSFLDYEFVDVNPGNYKAYIMSVLMQPDSFSDDFYRYIFNITTKDLDVEGSTGCTGTLIGGNMKKVMNDATAMNPLIRSGVMSLTCGVAWGSEEEKNHVATAERLAAGLLKFGNGTYFNEPSAYLPNWKVDYWGSHYNRLLEIKKLWDPTNVFSCYHCVGSDLVDGLTANPSTLVG